MKKEKTKKMVLTSSKQQKMGNQCAKHGKLLKTVLVLSICTACVAGAALASAAYWTDMIAISSEVSAMTIGIDYDEESAGLEDDSLYTPGDRKPFAFTVRNTGEISVDIKPVMTIKSDTDMVSGKSEFLIINADGEEPDTFEKQYFAEDGSELDADSVEAGAGFRQIKYTFSGETTLSGEMQQDESLGESSPDAFYNYELKLSELSRNDFLGAKASLDISTYAIQHRNREDGPTEWISIAEKS